MAIANIETILTPDEQEQIPPSIFGKYFVKGQEKGIEEGIDIGIEKGIGIGVEKGIGIGVEKGIGIGVEKGILIGIQRYIKKNPTVTDQSIADLFEVNIDLVQKARHSDPL